MCGICGKLNIHGQPIDRELIARMNAALSHRGPDDEGIYIENPSRDQFTSLSVGLGHRRLSILDLSSAGKQPISNEDQTIWLIFNGEIYNFRNLKQQLERQGHRFRSQMDGEVILHLYEEKGIECLHQLNGMFAFALWDSRKQTFFLCRDRVGIKPLVYFWDDQTLVFASEIKSLLKDPYISKIIDYDALNLYLTFNYIPAPHTIFQSIKKLPPAHYLQIKNHTMTLHPYWHLSEKSNSSISPVLNMADYQKELYRSLENAVKSHLMTDVPLGAFLSGGLDSSIIAGLMAKASSSPVSTFAVGYEDMPLFDERHYAKEVARMHHTDHHEIILRSRDVLDVVTHLLSSFDEPFADSSAIPTFIVSRETRKHLKVALSGDGGDELFAGYRMYAGEHLYNQYKRIPAFLRKGLFEPLLNSIPDSRDKTFLENIRRAKKFIHGAHDRFEDRFFSWNEIFSRGLRENLIKRPPEDWDEGKNIISNHLNTFRSDSINRMLYTDFTLSLPNDMLTKVDLMSMKNSLEVRVPLLDHRVVELAFQMPGDWKMRRGKGKYILKETFRNILPPSLLNRPKKGFEIPVGHWLKTDLKFLIDEYLSEKVIRKDGIFHFPPVKKLIDDLCLNRADTSWQLWNLIVFQAWHKRV